MKLGLTSSQGAHVAGHLLDSTLFGKSVAVRGTALDIDSHLEVALCTLT